MTFLNVHTVVTRAPNASQSGADTQSEFHRGGLSAAALQPVLQQVEATLDRPLRVSDMAGAVGLSLFHFSREFRRVTGTSPYAYIRRRRIARATLLLAGSKLPIVEIARVVGFKTHAHFSGAFLKTVGMTPRAYRLRYGPKADGSQESPPFRPLG